MSCKCGPDSGHDVFVLKSIGRYLQLFCFVIAGFSKPSYRINQISLPYLAIKCNQNLLDGGNYSNATKISWAVGIIFCCNVDLLYVTIFIIIILV